VPAAVAFLNGGYCILQLPAKLFILKLIAAYEATLNNFAPAGMLQAAAIMRCKLQHEIRPPNFA